MSYPTFGTAVNIDPRYSPANPDPAHGFGMNKIHGFRFVSRNDAEVNRYLDHAKDCGKHLMAVVTPESEGYVYYGADIVQIGNEPDLPGTYLSPEEYAAYYNLYRDTYDGSFPYFSLAGLGSGLGNAGVYLSDLWPRLNHKPDLVAVHCYDGNVQQASDEIVDLWNRVQTPVIVTEWNHAIDQMWDMMVMLNGPEGLSTAWHSMYPYSTAMNSSLQGLVDHTNQPTLYGGAFVSAPYI